MRGAHGHTDAVREPLAERAGCDLDTGRKSVFRMAGSFRTPLTEVFKFVERQVVAGQMEKGVDQHRAVTCGEQKAVAVFPLRVPWVVTQKTCPQNVSHRRGAERQTGMTRLCFLDGVEGQGTNGVDAQMIEFAVGEFIMHRRT